MTIGCYRTQYTHLTDSLYCDLCVVEIPVYYLRRLLASGEGIVSLGVRHAVTLRVSAALVSAAKVMHCIQCSLVIITFAAV